ncbi:MAG TPA: hypothetical protein VGS79_04745 [Puia sp.]|nr:hypothetical protein [Puia sp.]
MKNIVAIVALSFSLIGSSKAQNSTSLKLPLKTGKKYLDIFMANGDSLIIRPQHLGIVNGMASVGINHQYVGVINGFFAPPYVSTYLPSSLTFPRVEKYWASPYTCIDYFLEPRFFGERVKAKHYTWLPFQTKRVGEIKGVRIQSTTTLIYGMRAGVLSINLKNLTGQKKQIPLQFIANDPFTPQTTLDKIEVWGYGKPQSKTPVKNVVDDKGLMRIQGDYAIGLGLTLKNWTWEELTGRFHSMVYLQPGEEKEFSLVFSIGEKKEALDARNAILANPSLYVSKATDKYISEVKNLFDKLPRFYSDNKDLEQMYVRSVMILLLNRFEVPEFALHPYYATGSIKGGCMISDLGNFGGVSEILPLLDPEADKAHILQFIKSGALYHGSAFDPITGKSAGPWNPENQEKIIDLTYNYVKNTGDNGFLNEEVNGETILDHLIRNAMYQDDRERPVKLIDYGPGRVYLNGLRYKNYERVSRLCELAGKPQPSLMERAGDLKEMLKKQLWDPNIKWFTYQDDKGNKDARYTVQMFYLLNSDVIDREIKEGLLSHLNDREFFSDYGLHSISKKDSAYDQVGVANGGGTTSTLCPPEISELLYKEGDPKVADEIMGRILWWGRRLPYFGESQFANEIDYGQDTTLQADIGSAAVAQSILFGMFGISADFNGNISINPVKTTLANRLEIKGLKIRGKTLDVSVEGGKYEVSTGDKTFGNNLGTATIIKN